MGRFVFCPRVNTSKTAPSSCTCWRVWAVGWTWFCLVASSRLVASNEFGQRRSDHCPLPLPLYAPHYYYKYSYTTRERPWRS